MSVRRAPGNPPGCGGNLPPFPQRHPSHGHTAAGFWRSPDSARAGDDRRPQRLPLIVAPMRPALESRLLHLLQRSIMSLIASFFRSPDRRGVVFPGVQEVCMSRNVRCSLIQATNAAPPDASLESTKKAMVDKHVDVHRAGRRRGRADRVPAGDFLRSVFLRRADHPLVRLHRADSRRPDHPAHAGPGPPAPRRPGRPGLRNRAGGRLLQHRGGHPQRRHVPRQIPQDPHPARRAGLLGEVLFPARQPGLSRFSTWASPRSASTSATTATFRKGRARWA